MRNFVQPGENVTLLAPAAVSSGELVKVGNLYGIALGDAESGEPVVLVTVGAFPAAEDRDRRPCGR